MTEESSGFICAAAVRDGVRYIVTASEVVDRSKFVGAIATVIGDTGSYRFRVPRDSIGMVEKLYCFTVAKDEGDRAVMARWLVSTRYTAMKCGSLWELLGEAFCRTTLDLLVQDTTHRQNREAVSNAAYSCEPCFKARPSVGDGKLARLPLNGHAPDNESIAQHADHIAEGLREHGAAKARNLVCIIEYEDGDLQRLSCGKPIMKSELVGLLTMAIHREMKP